MRWVHSSSATVRPPRCVGTVATTLKVSGLCSRTTVSVPSPFELNASRVAGSKAAPSTPAPIGRVARTRPLSASLTARSEEHTSELQSLAYLVCRLLLEKKKKHRIMNCDRDKGEYD